jgi:ABC-type multidrug transport system fused ATPase/permease subunit
MKEFMAKYWARYVLAFVLVNIISIMALIAPLLTERIIDEFIPQGDLKGIALYAILVLGVATARALITFSQRYNIEFTLKKLFMMCEIACISICKPYRLAFLIRIVPVN